MAAAAIGAIPQGVRPQNIRFSIEENRMSQKLLCVIPIAGFVYSLFQQFSLLTQFEVEMNPQKAVFIARVLNDYHKADIVRCIITVALIIFAISSAFISPQNVLANFILGGSLGNLGRSISALCTNQYEIWQIEENPNNLHRAVLI